MRDRYDLDPPARETSKMTIVERYLALNFVKATGLVLMLLLALFSFLGFAEALEDVGTGSFTTSDAVSVVFLTTPKRITDLLPVSALLGAILGLGAMANYREIIVMRVAGLSPWRLARGPCAAALGLIFVTVVLQNYVIPAVERQAQEFRSRTLSQTTLGGGTEFWSRHDNRFIRVGGVEFGRIPQEIEIYEIGPHGRLQRMLQAHRADIIDEQTWMLFGVQEKILGDDAIRYRVLDELEWQSFLSREQLSTLQAPAYSLSSADLYRYIRAMEGSGVNTHQYESIFWRQISVPLALIAMTLLGLPFVIGSVQSHSTGFRLVIGAAVGIGFYLLEQMTGHLSTILEIPAAPSALLPAVLALTVALVGLRRLS